MSVFKKALQNFAETNERAWDHDARAQTVGASEIGQCQRKVGYLKHPEWKTERDGGYTDSWGAKARGNYYENHFWVPAVREAFGEDAYYTGDKQKTFTHDCLSATPDGLIVNQPQDALASLGVKDLGEDNCYVVDCKTIDPRATLNEPKPEHVHQVHIQIGLIRETTKWTPSYGVLSYTNASFWDEVHEFVVEYDPDVYKHSKLRAANIMYAEDPKDLPAEGWIAGGKDCQYCPFTKACGVDRRDLPSAKFDKITGKDGLDADHVSELTERAARMVDYRSEAKRCESAMRAEQEEIKNLMRGMGRRKLAFDGYKFSWTEVKGREGFDKDAALTALSQAGFDPSNFVKPGTPGDRLTVSVPGMQTETEE